MLLLKNIIPSPIFIVDFENEKIKFFNNAAFEFINGFENELMQTFQEENYFIERNDSFIEKVY